MYTSFISVLSITFTYHIVYIKPGNEYEKISIGNNIHISHSLYKTNPPVLFLDDFLKFTYHIVYIKLSFKYSLYA